MPLTVTQQISVVCEGPKCSQTYTWTENKPEDVPDGAYRLLALQPFVGEKRVFCSKTCLLDWLRDYAPPLSPRQQAEEAAKTALKPPIIIPSNPTLKPQPLDLPEAGAA